MRNCFEGNNNENCRGLLHGNRLFAVGAYAHGCDGAADELAHAFDEFLGLFRNLFPRTAGGNVLHPAGHRFIVPLTNRSKQQNTSHTYTERQ